MFRAFIIHLIARVSRIRHAMTDSCIFCKIVSGDAKAEIVYRDEKATAFRDIHPVARTHILIVPNKHIESVGSLEAEDEPLIGHLFVVAQKIAREEDIAHSGFRLITNTGADGGQTVYHLHVHFIGGNRMKHPMG